MDEFIADIGRLEVFLADVGRTADEMAIARRCYVVLDDEPDVARTRHADWFEAAYGDASLVDAALVTGSIDDIRDVLQRLTDAGVTDVILSPLERIDEHLESLSRLLYTSQK